MLTSAGGNAGINGGSSGAINSGNSGSSVGGAASTTGGGCPCASVTINNSGSSGISSGGSSANAFIYDDPTTSNAETLLSSNAKFQSISAIAVAQDGVINVADQGMCLFFFCCYFSVLSHYVF